MHTSSLCHLCIALLGTKIRTNICHKNLFNAYSRARKILLLTSAKILMTLRWRHNERDSVSNHQPHDCLLNRLFRRRSKKTSKLRVTGLCVGNSPGTGEFSAQMASYAENVSIWWRHHGDFYWRFRLCSANSWITNTINTGEQIVAKEPLASVHIIHWKSMLFRSKSNTLRTGIMADI